MLHRDASLVAELAGQSPNRFRLTSKIGEKKIVSDWEAECLLFESFLRVSWEHVVG